MANRSEDREKLTEIINNLRTCRTDLVRIEMQCSQLEQKKRLLDLDLKKIETTKILEVNALKDGTGKPLVLDTELKGAMVEDFLAKDERFIALMHKRGLLFRNLQRKVYKGSMLRAKILDLEAREKMIVLT